MWRNMKSGSLCDTKIEQKLVVNSLRIGYLNFNIDFEWLAIDQESQFSEVWKYIFIVISNILKCIPPKE